jgi:hypothetical protein
MADIVINEFYKGVADSAHIGFEQMVNLDVFSNPGIAKINYKTASKHTPTGLIRWFVQDPAVSTNFYALDSTGRVYKSTDSGDTWTLVTGNSLTSASGEGLNIWKDYLWVLRASNADVYGPLSGSPAWTTGFVSGSAWAATEHPTLVSSDDSLYWGGGRYVLNIYEVATKTFSPSDATTYVVNQNALDLPANYNAKTLAEQGRWLLIGTYKGSVYYQQKVADIFPWDKISPSYNNPIKLGEFGVNQMITTTDNRVLAVAGREHTIYLTDIVNSSRVRKLSNLLRNDETTYGPVVLDPQPGAIMNHKGRVFMGVSANNVSNPAGVYSFIPSDGLVTLENTISSGHIDGLMQIGALISIDENSYLMSSQRQGAGYTIDKVLGTGTSAKRYTGYVAEFRSQLYEIGTPLQKRKLQELNIILAKPLGAGQGFKIQWRESLDDGWSQMVIFDYATYGAAQYLTYPWTGKETATIQIRGLLTTDTSTHTTPELKEVRIR